jgi:hypothetical protein
MKVLSILVLLAFAPLSFAFAQATAPADSASTIADTAAVNSAARAAMDAAVIDAPVIARTIDTVRRTTQAWALGASFGTPAGLNAVAGYTGTRLFARASGMYLGTSLSGAQLDLGFVVRRNSRLTMTAGPIAGTTHIEIDDTYSHRTLNWSYLGGAFSMQIGGLFGQLGLSWGTGNEHRYEWDPYEGPIESTHPVSNPQLLGQIGYVYEFR